MSFLYTTEYRNPGMFNFPASLHKTTSIFLKCQENCSKMSKIFRFTFSIFCDILTARKAGRPSGGGEKHDLWRAAARRAAERAHDPEGAGRARQRQAQFRQQLGERPQPAGRRHDRAAVPGAAAAAERFLRGGRRLPPPAL